MGKGSGSGAGSGGSQYYLKGGHALVGASSPTEPPALAHHTDTASLHTSSTRHVTSSLLHHRPKGLCNVGNTCYANAVLQCLLSTALTHALLDPEAGAIFRRYSSNPTLLEQGSGSVDSAEFEYNDNSMDDSSSRRSRRRQRKPATDKVLNENRKWLTRELKSLTREYHMVVPEEAPSFMTSILSLYSPSAGRVVDPGTITRHPHRLSPCLRPYQQEDAHEFLRGLLSTLVMNGQNKQLSSLFDGLLESSVTCQTCQRPSLTRDRYMDLSLDIDQPHINTLSDALEHFTATETLEGDNKVYCTRCESKQPATKGLRLATAPSILVCHLKRFALNANTGRLRRINKHIQVAPRLQIGPHMSKVNKARPPPYDLVAMLVHLGTTCEAGHYVAFVKHGGEWYECNDSLVSKVDVSKVLRQQAYILMYEVAEMRSNHGYPCPHQYRNSPPRPLPNYLMCGMLDESLLGDFCCGSPLFGARSRPRRTTARDDSTIEDSTTTTERRRPPRPTMKRSSSSGNLKEPTQRPEYIMTKKWLPGELPPRAGKRRATSVNNNKKVPKPPLATRASTSTHRRSSSANLLPPIE